MRIVAARLTPFALPLRSALVTAHGVTRTRGGVLVALESADGARGFGEATPPFGDSDAALRRVFDAAERLCAEALARGPQARLAADADPAARFAVETALLDLRAQARGVSLARLVAGGREPRRSVRVNALLSRGDPEAAAREAREAAERGFRTLKLKVGVASRAQERARLAAVRAAVGRESELRIDANGAWSADEAIGALAAFEDLGLELVEQPVAAADLAGLARVRAAVRTPVAADESVASAESAERLLAARAVDLLVLKPGALGGLEASLVLARRARERGLGCFATSGLDGAIARAAALALAAALPDPLPACGLATGTLLAADLAPGPEPKDGALDVPDAPGLGVAPDARALRDLALGPARELVAP